MKTQRHAKLLELIAEYNVETQEDLLEYLKQCNFKVTQATVSRDIKELKLIKTPAGNGKYKYTAGNKSTANIGNNLETLFKSTVISVDFANNMIVLKTLNGMAQGVCATLDAMEWDGIVGTIAGDDTIFIVARSNSQAITLTSELKKIM